MHFVVRIDDAGGLRGLTRRVTNVEALDLQRVQHERIGVEVERLGGDQHPALKVAHDLLGFAVEKPGGALRIGCVILC